MSTIIIKVDLQCSLCYKKIKKTLCKLQGRGKISSVVYDEKNDKVTVSGPFDPKKLIKKICYNACKVIKDIEIVQEPVDPPLPPPRPETPTAPSEPGIGFEAYYGGCRCCSCGCVYGPPVVYGEPYYDGFKTCHFICEEEYPSCRIM